MRFEENANRRRAQPIQWVMLLGFLLQLLAAIYYYGKLTAVVETTASRLICLEDKVDRLIERDPPTRKP